MRQVVLDTETTGLEVEQGHRVIEIGAVELVDRRFTERQFHCYLNPERDIEQGALEVHGITEAFLEDKPKFAEVAAAAGFAGSVQCECQLWTCRKSHRAVSAAGE